MNYIYILVPLAVSVILFSVTLGYFLFIKWQSTRKLKQLRNHLINERCGVKFLEKPPEVTRGREAFSGIYREPSFSNLNTRINDNPQNSVLEFDDPGFPTTSSGDSRQSDILEIPMRPRDHRVDYHDDSLIDIESQQSPSYSIDYYSEHLSKMGLSKTHTLSISPPLEEAPPLPPPRDRGRDYGYGAQVYGSPENIYNLSSQMSAYSKRERPYY